MSPSPRGSCSAARLPAALLSSELPRDAQPPPPPPAFGDRPKNAGSESEALRGGRGQPGEIHRSERPCCGVEGRTWGSPNPAIGTDPEKGCFREQRGSARMLCGGQQRRSPGAGWARALWEPHRFPRSRTNRLQKTIDSAKPRLRDRFCRTAEPEPNEASNSQIIFDHFFSWRRIIEI